MSKRSFHFCQNGFFHLNQVRKRSGEEGNCPFTSPQTTYFKGFTVYTTGSRRLTPLMVALTRYLGSSQFSLSRICALPGSTQASSLCRVLLTQCPLTVILKAYRDPPLAWKKNCLIQTTPWSPCSKTCGLGISVRVNNDNGKCEMRKDRRLCLLRPCEKSVLKNLKVTTEINSIKILTWFKNKKN